MWIVAYCWISFNTNLNFIYFNLTITKTISSNKILLFSHSLISFLSSSLNTFKSSFRNSMVDLYLLVYSSYCSKIHSFLNRFNNCYDKKKLFKLHYKSIKIKLIMSICYCIIKLLPTIKLAYNPLNRKSTYG